MQMPKYGSWLAGLSTLSPRERPRQRVCPNGESILYCRYLKENFSTPINDVYMMYAHLPQSFEKHESEAYNAEKNHTSKYLKRIKLRNYQKYHAVLASASLRRCNKRVHTPRPFSLVVTSIAVGQWAGESILMRPFVPMMIVSSGVSACA